MQTITKIVENVLMGIYQPAGFALLTSFYFMFFYLVAMERIETGNGWKKTIKLWFSYFKTDILFRRIFFLVLYAVLILFRTLFSRNMWINPLSNVMGGWWIYGYNYNTGEYVLTTECFENMILFIPFSVLFLSVLALRNIYIGQLKKSIIQGTKTVFLFSISIELFQLFFRVGTFQLADIFYNTLGGFLGCFLYVIIYKLIMLFKK